MVEQKSQRSPNAPLASVNEGSEECWIGSKPNPSSAIPRDDVHKAVGGRIQHGKKPVAQPLAECSKYLGWCCSWILDSRDAPSADGYVERDDPTEASVLAQDTLIQESGIRGAKESQRLIMPYLLSDKPSIIGHKPPLDQWRVHLEIATLSYRSEPSLRHCAAWAGPARAAWCRSLGAAVHSRVDHRTLSIPDEAFCLHDSLNHVLPD